MDSEKVKEVICNAVKTTEPTWSTWGVHWKELDEVFLSRAYDQLGFDDWIFVNFLRDNDILSIKKVGSILDNGCFERKYDREIAGGIEMPFYIFLKKGIFGKEGKSFYNSVRAFDGRKGAAFWKLLWQMLVCCNYLKKNYNSSFSYYLKEKYAEYENIDKVTDADFLHITQQEWDSFKENKKPWNELYGVGLNVFDYIMGDVLELEFVKNSYKLDSANQRFLTITGIFECNPKDLNHEEVVNFLSGLNLPYSLREINSGLYAYCSKLGCDKYCFCRYPQKCHECKVHKICKQDFDKFKKHDWIKKSPEEMTEEERKVYESSVRDKFTWKEGDLKFVGWEPLTEDEKKLVESIDKADRETEDRNINDD